MSSTLKITSAMKMVSSAKLRSTQKAMGNMVPYESQLSEILYSLLSSGGSHTEYSSQREVRNVALVCFSSNSTLCGAFNSNVIRSALSVVKEYASQGIGVTVYSIGRRMADAMARAGYPSPSDYSAVSSHPSYDAAAALGKSLSEDFLSGRFDKVEFIYNHYKSASSQQLRRDVYLPFSAPEEPGTPTEAPEGTVYQTFPRDYIIEPDRESLIAELLPKVLKLKVYTVLLDAAAAEHAARVMAMQTATDNANGLLVTLTLEYNKSRQQKITSEILDIVGGSMQ